MMSLMTGILSVFIIILLGVLAAQTRAQYLARGIQLSDDQEQLYLSHEADESTTFIVSRAMEHVIQGTHDSNLQNNFFALQVIREFVKPRVAEERWPGIQSNESLVYELSRLLFPPTTD